jgi:hypothetical protein
MKRSICFRFFCFLVLCAFLPVWSAYAEEPVYKALNPRGTRPDVKLFPLTPRLTDFNGKVVYVISQHVGDADIFLKKVANALPTYMPGVKAVYVDKPSTYMTDDPELWDEVAKKAHMYIYGAAA